MAVASSRVIAGIDYGMIALLLSRVLEVSEDSGKASYGTTTTLRDISKNWERDMWKGATVHIFHGDVEYVRTVTSNTEDTLVFGALPEPVSAGDQYVIRRPISIVDVKSDPIRELGVIDNVRKWGGAVLTARDVSQDLARLQNIDVLLSSRASETTLSSILNKIDVALSSRASETTLASISGKIDVALSVLSALIRFGRNVSVSWVHGGEVTAPAAGTALVSRTVSSGKSGYIYGFFISAGEANDFKINWTSGGTSRSIRIPFGAKGAIHYADFIPLNEGMAADGGTTITITNVNAGGSGVIYQARLLYSEV